MYPPPVILALRLRQAGVRHRRWARSPNGVMLIIRLRPSVTRAMKSTSANRLSVPAVPPNARPGQTSSISSKVDNRGMDIRALSTRQAPGPNRGRLTMIDRVWLLQANDTVSPRRNSHVRHKARRSQSSHRNMTHPNAITAHHGLCAVRSRRWGQHVHAGGLAIDGGALATSCAATTSAR